MGVFKSQPEPKQGELSSTVFTFLHSLLEKGTLLSSAYPLFLLSHSVLYCYLSLSLCLSLVLAALLFSHSVC